MGDPDDAPRPADPEPTAGPAPISRRESLRRSAGLLALGLGAPTAWAAGVGPGRPTSGAELYQLKFYRGEGDERPLAVDIPAEVAEVLADRGGFEQLKVEWYRDERGEEPRTLAAYEIRRYE